jgi:hypothetical protein
MDSLPAVRTGYGEGIKQRRNASRLGASAPLLRYGRRWSRPLIVSVPRLTGQGKDGRRFAAAGGSRRLGAPDGPAVP